MLSEAEKITDYLNNFSFAEIRNAYITRSRVETRRIPGMYDQLIVDGFERLDGVVKGSLLTEDGREILWYKGTPWALTRAEHERRLQEAFREREEFVKQGGEMRRELMREAVQSESQDGYLSGDYCMKIIDGTPCGGELLVKKVCPSSDLGRRGIKRISKCSVCETVSILEATEKFSKEIKNG